MIGSRRSFAVFVAVVVVLLTSCSSSTTSSTPSAAPSGTGTGTTATQVAPTGSTPSGTAARTGATASPGCTASGDKPKTGEQVDLTMTSGGQTRAYKQYVPATAKATPNPLVVDLHGYSEGYGIHVAMSNLSSLADTEGFLLVTPQGTGDIPFWNAVPEPGVVDDVLFVSDLIDHVGEWLCVDPARVFVTGLSNGAFMTSLVACRLADKVAAVAPVAGVRFPDDCTPSRPVPMIAFHGTADPFVSYDGSPGPAAQKLPLNDVTKKAFSHLTFGPIPETVARWAKAEQCADTATEDKVSQHVTRIHYDGCRGGSAVELYRVEGGGHAWPGSAFSAAGEAVLGPTTMEIDADQLMWAFFQQHPMPTA